MELQGDTLQRLFSTFPDGGPGAGLLLLRAAVGAVTFVGGILYLASPALPTLEKWPLGLFFGVSGAALAIGFFTPLVAGLIALAFLCAGLSWIPEPFAGLHDTMLIAFGMLITAVAVALLGPGAFSLDGYLFGRREVVIPPPPDAPDS